MKFTNTNMSFIKILMMLIIVGLLVFSSVSTNVNPNTGADSGIQVEYTAVVKNISTSGDTRFYWYDIESKTIINPNDEHNWFFALPENVPEDKLATEKWVDLIMSNQVSVFKITGTRAEDDCEYYGPENCVQNIAVEKIKII